MGDAVKRVADDGRGREIRAACAGEGILDEVRSRGGAVGEPKLVIACGVRRSAIVLARRAAGAIGDAGGAAADDVAHPICALWRSGAAAALVPRLSVVAGEVEDAVVAEEITDLRAVDAGIEITK